MNSAFSVDEFRAARRGHRFISRLRYRLSQGIGALIADIPIDREETLSTLLSPPQHDAFLNLPAHDQAHLLRVVAMIAQSDSTPSHDLLVAALLHDIGKVSPNGRVRMPDRILRVLLSRYAPRLWVRLSRLPARGWRTGMVLAEHHPGLGAELAASLGCSGHACWLIAHHGDATLPNNSDLRRLVAADHAAR